MYLEVMVGKFVKQDVREWCPSTTGPLLPTMTDSLLAPGQAPIVDSMVVGHCRMDKVQLTGVYDENASAAQGPASWANARRRTWPLQSDESLSLLRTRGE